MRSSATIGKSIVLLVCTTAALTVGCSNGSSNTSSSGDVGPRHVSDVVVQPTRPLDATFRWESRLAHGYVFWRQSNGVRRFDLIDGDLDAPQSGRFVIETGFTELSGSATLSVGCYWLRPFLSSHVSLSCGPGPSPVEWFIYGFLGADLGAYQRTETVMDKTADCYEFNGDLLRGSLCYEQSTGAPLTVWVLGRDGLDSLEIQSMSTDVEDFVPSFDLASAASISLPAFERTLPLVDLRLPSALGVRD